MASWRPVKLPRDARRVLWLGCGDGTRLGAGIASGREVIGVEGDAALVAAAREHLTRVVPGDLDQLARRGGVERQLGSFDALVADGALGHARDPWLVLRTFAALLRPGGTALLALPNARAWALVWPLLRRGTWPVQEAAAPLRLFTARDAERLALAAGLRVERVEARFASRGARAAARWGAVSEFAAAEHLVTARR